MILIYILIFSTLSIYTFSQVDLNLNLSQNSTYLFFENQMKQLGFYNRPLSFWIFVIISISLILLYAFIIKKLIISPIHFRFQIPARRIGGSNFKFILIIFLFLYFLVYPAFLSYDIFNYLFDAKILTKYYQNPYFHYALQYRFDTWTRFMRWTTRVYPYGPIWLLATIVPVFLGFDKLVLTIFTFKIFNLAVFLGCLKTMQLILKKLEKPVEWIYAFALNPIIIYDFLISMHNESLMLLFLLVSIYFFVGDNLRVVPQKSFLYRFLSIFFLLLSIGVKYLTVIFLPIYIGVWIYSHYRDNHSRANVGPGLFNITLDIGALFYFLAIIALATTREFYSWYFIVPIALLVLNFSKTKAIILIVLSFLILRYSPFILFGEYNKTVVFWQNWISYIVIGVVFAIVLFAIQSFITKWSFPHCRES